MLYLKNPIAKPVSLWWYDMPDGVRLTHADEASLYRLCTNHGYQGHFNEWHALMIHHVCLAINPELCGGHPGSDQRVVQLTFAGIKGYIRAVNSVLVSSVKFEKTHVNQAEADRRSEICLRCTQRGAISCVGCHGFLASANIFVQNREFKNQTALHNQGCLICGCFLLPTIWASPEVLRRVDKAHLDSFPDNCWRAPLAKDD